MLRVYRVASGVRIVVPRGLLRVLLGISLGNLGKEGGWEEGC